MARSMTSCHSLDLVAIADVSPGLCERATHDHPTVATFTSFEDFLSHTELDAVVLATPASGHAPLGLEVLRSGRHLLVEKPFALDLTSAEELVKEAEARDLVLMAGHTFLYSPALIYLRTLITDGSLGSISSLHSQRLLGQARQDCNVIWDLAPHDVSIILQLVGERPTQVTARGFAHLHGDQIDTCFANMTFPSDIDASIHVSWVNPHKVRLLTLIGTNCMAVFDDVPIDQKVTVYGAGLAHADPFQPEASPLFASFDLGTRMSDTYVPSLPAVESLSSEMEDFGRACAAGQVPVASGRFGLDVVAVLEAIDTAVSQPGAPVHLDWSRMDQRIGRPA